MRVDVGLFNFKWCAADLAARKGTWRDEIERRAVLYLILIDLVMFFYTHLLSSAGA